MPPVIDNINPQKPIGEGFMTLDEYDIMNANSWTTLLLSRSASWGPMVDAIERFCYSTSDYIGPAFGYVTFEDYWFKRPIVHIIEFVAFMLFVGILHWCTNDYIKRFVLQKKTPRNRLRDSFLDKFLGVVFVALFISQAFFKLSRPLPAIQVWWLIMPCHLFTIGWSYCLLSRKKGKERNRNLSIYLASVMAACQWGPIAAALFPDWGDHQYPIEGTIFVIHHALLIGMPFYWAARYELLPANEEFFIHVTALATFVNIFFYAIVSYITGLNMNYMLAPPGPLRRNVQEVWDNPWYRVPTIFFLILWTLFFRTLHGVCAWLMKPLFRALRLREADDAPDQSKKSEPSPRSAARIATTPKKSRSD